MPLLAELTDSSGWIVPLAKYCFRGDRIGNTAIRYKKCK